LLRKKAAPKPSGMKPDIRVSMKLRNPALFGGVGTKSLRWAILLPAAFFPGGKNAGENSAA